jgi:hypothetical protein
MPTTPVVVSSDGPRFTVADLIGNPLAIPTKLKERMANIFISTTLLRNAGGNNNGLVSYTEGDPSFLDTDVQDVAEFAEIPVAAGRMGVPRIAVGTKRALGVRVSREMRDRNKIDAVNKQMTQLANTFERADDNVIKALLGSAAVPTLPVDEPWDTAEGNPRLDLALARKEVTRAAPDADAGGSAQEWYGFRPDTVVINDGLLPVLMDNEKFLKVYQGNVADMSVELKGELPDRIFGMQVVTSMAFPDDKILLLQRGVVGFYSDERPLEFTGLYPEGGGPNGGPTESWRSDASHIRVYGLDQPKAAIWLTDIV